MKLVLELRRREVVFAMLLFILATIVIVHFALGGDRGAGERAAAGMLWAAVVFTAVLGLLRTFSAEHEGGVLDALLLAPIDRAAIWLGTALAQLGFLLVIEVVAVPLWSVVTSAADNAPAVVEKVTGVEGSTFPLMSSTLATICVDPPIAETLAGLALSRTRPTAALPTAIFSAPFAPVGSRYTRPSTWPSRHSRAACGR